MSKPKRPIEYGTVVGGSAGYQHAAPTPERRAALAGQRSALMSAEGHPMTAPTPDLDAIRARVEAATYLGGETQEVADDALALLAEVARLRRELGSFIDGCLYVSRSHADQCTRDCHRSIAEDLRAIVHPHAALTP